MSSWLGYLEALALCPLYVLAFVLSFLLVYHSFSSKRPPRLWSDMCPTIPTLRSTRSGCCLVPLIASDTFKPGRCC